MASWIIMIPLGLLLSWLVMHHTHKIAGPIYKFESILEDMSRGVLNTDIHLRKNDDGQLAAPANCAVHLHQGLTGSACGNHHHNGS